MFRAKKQFGQHFLKDQYVLSMIADYCHLKSGDSCIEIGPGQGALTKHLLKTKAKIQAIELDKRLIPILDGLKDKYDNFTYLMSDVLDVNFSELIGDQNSKIVGNLPYEISTPLLFKLIEDRSQITMMVFLLQKEVVDRIVAKVGTNDYSRLSVMMQYYFDTEGLLLVEKEAFTPPPKVTSQVVRLKPIEREWVDHGAFEAFVKFLFLNRRKMLRQKFKGRLRVEKWSEIGIDETRRPQTLNMDEILHLFAYCQANNIAY